MRNWCAALAMGALLALPLCAQQKNSGADGDTANAAEKSRASSKAVAAQGLLALPVTPRPTPFPGPAAAADTRPPGTLVPRYEFSAMYDYINFAPGDPFANFNSHGGAGSFTYKASKWLGPYREVGRLSVGSEPLPASGSRNA